ncbi:hypothetical protein HDU67_005947 [Dinochytrium kinnereticum]|nr:hypothetical protein HDU67_005947 [Dinochytrium kinnereticum]
MAFSFNKDNWEVVQGPIDQAASYAFGRTNLEGDTFFEYFKPTFYNGSLTPPKDGEDIVPPEEIIEGSAPAIVIRTSQALAGISCMAKSQRNICTSLDVVPNFRWNVWYRLNILERQSSLFILCRRIWLYHNLRQLFRPMDIPGVLLTIFSLQSINCFLVLFWRFGQSLADEKRICSPLSGGNHFDYKAALGAINLGLPAIALTLILMFKDRSSSTSFDNVLRISSFLFISIIVLEFILRPTILRSIIQALTLNVLPVVVCLHVCLRATVSDDLSEYHFQKHLQPLTCFDQGIMKVATRGKFGWGQECKYLVTFWERSLIPWLILIEIDGSKTYRIDLEKIKQSDILTETELSLQENSAQIDLDGRFTDKKIILLVLPHIYITFRCQSTETRDRMVGLLKSFASGNEVKARRNETMANSNREWKSDLSGMDLESAPAQVGDASSSR